MLERPLPTPWEPCFVSQTSMSMRLTEATGHVKLSQKLHWMCCLPNHHILLRGDSHSTYLGLCDVVEIASFLVWCTVQGKEKEEFCMCRRFCGRTIQKWLYWTPYWDLAHFNHHFSDRPKVSPSYEFSSSLRCRQCCSSCWLTWTELLHNW